jgi:hypothetical protein
LVTAGVGYVTAFSTAVVFAATPWVVTVNDTLVAPAGTTTVAGTVAAAGLPDPNVTVRPPVGAALAIFTVPVTGLPPTIESADRPMLVTAGGRTVILNPTDVNPVFRAAIVTFVLAATVPVFVVRLADVVPAGIVIEAGTAARVVLLDVRFTTNPPIGAGLSRVTVPVPVPALAMIGWANVSAKLVGAG